MLGGRQRRCREVLPCHVPRRAVSLVDEAFLAPVGPEPLPVGAQPSFSVLVASYNAAATVGDAVASALAQSLAPLEVVVCDDGSSDDLAGALEPYAGRIRLVRRENGGEGAAKNTAAAAASGTFLVFLDADDTFAPTRLERLAACAVARPDLDVLTTDAHLVVDGARVGRCYSPSWPFEVADQRREILRRNFVFGLAAVRRERFKAIGGFDPQFSHAVDWDLWIRLILSGSRVGLVTEPLAEYRLGRSSLSADRARLLRGRAAVLAKAAHLGALTEAERTAVLALANENRANATMVEAWVALRDRRPGARSLAFRVARERGLPAGTRLKAIAAVAVPAVGGALVRRAEARHGVAGPAGVQFAR
jgi:glycosyltransferase involved in cell wall biosynthesis